MGLKLVVRKRLLERFLDRRSPAAAIGANARMAVAGGPRVGSAAARSAHGFWHGNILIRQEAAENLDRRIV
jgi:hypothetical protein